MDESWLLLLATLCSFAGTGWLALAKAPHWQQVNPVRQHPHRRLTCVGVAAVLLALGLCFQADYPSIALLVWVMLLSASALAVTMLLSWRAHWLRILVMWPSGRDE